MENTDRAVKRVKDTLTNIRRRPPGAPDNTNQLLDQIVAALDDIAADLRDLDERVV